MLVCCKMDYDYRADIGPDGWYRCRWKYNHRIDKSYFGDPYEMDDYDDAEDGAGPTHFLLIPPLPTL